MSIRNKPRDAAVFGIDIGKAVFHVVGRPNPEGHFQTEDVAAVL